MPSAATPSCGRNEHRLHCSAVPMPSASCAPDSASVRSSSISALDARVSVSESSTEAPSPEEEAGKPPSPSPSLSSISTVSDGTPALLLLPVLVELSSSPAASPSPSFTVSRASSRAPASIAMAARGSRPSATEAVGNASGCDCSAGGGRLLLPALRAPAGSATSMGGPSCACAACLSAGWRAASSASTTSDSCPVWRSMSEDKSNTIPPSALCWPMSELRVRMARSCPRACESPPPSARRAVAALMRASSILAAIASARA
mmetsp:Transcript_6096/g.24306  ORF Transcript_6096/g.24306 Transcript_6096/m.24306 type:complete len:261 (+) Transcript_6096:1696-2478(+)